MGMLLVRGTPELPESRNNVVHDWLRVQDGWFPKETNTPLIKEYALNHNIEAPIT